MPNFYVAPQMKENPFYYEEIGQDEYITESAYYHHCIARWANGEEFEYKPICQQLKDGDIESIPELYKRLCLDPDWDKELKK